MNAHSPVDVGFMDACRDVVQRKLFRVPPTLGPLESRLQSWTEVADELAVLARNLRVHPTEVPKDHHKRAKALHAELKAYLRPPGPDLPKGYYARWADLDTACARLGRT